MTKAEEILRKEITLFEWGKENDKQLITYEDALKAVNKAINYTHSCESFTAEEVINVLDSSYELIDAKSFFEDCKKQQYMFYNGLAMNSNGLIITKLNKYVQN